MSGIINDEIDDTWGSDFDEEDEDDNNKVGDFYEIPDGKPKCNPSNVPEWLKKVEKSQDENIKPNPAYIENVLLPTRLTKDEDSKTFIEALKRKLSQKNSTGSVGGGNNTKPCTPVNNQPIRKLERLNSTEIENIKKIKESVQKFPWFYRVDRNKAELILENYTSDGSFLVRECHHGGPNVPFTLTIRFSGRLFHIQIRLRPDSNFGLGSPKLNEMHFGSIQEMIDTYRKTPLQLHTNGKYFGETKLTNPPIVYSFSK